MRYRHDYSNYDHNNHKGVQVSRAGERVRDAAGIADAGYARGYAVVE
jgi:hypothetical protein